MCTHMGPSRTTGRPGGLAPGPAPGLTCYETSDDFSSPPVNGLIPLSPNSSQDQTIQGARFVSHLASEAERVLPPAAHLHESPKGFEG